MGRTWNKDLPVEQDLRHWRLKLLKYYALWFAVLSGVVSVVTWKYYSGIVLSKEPLLKGPPEFILLALIVAFTAYLRQVHMSAIEQRDKIRKGEVWNYPLHTPYHEYTKAKIEALDSVAESLAIASPFLVWLFVLAAFRIVVEAVLRLSPTSSLSYPRWLYIFDFAIAFWVLGIFIILALTHWHSRRRNAEIRAVERAFEDEVGPQIGSEKEKPPVAQENATQDNLSDFDLPPLPSLRRPTSSPWFVLLVAVSLVYIGYRSNRNK